MEELIKDFGKALTRTPLYSWHYLFSEDGSTVNLETRVRHQLNDPVFTEAIYWSSPQLFERVQKLKAGKLSKEKEQNLMHTLKKYLVRAHTRSTPYGIFAGTGIVNIDERNAAVNQPERKVRVDSGLLRNILRRIETDADIYLDLKYYINDTVYRIPGQFRFTEKLIEENKTEYQLSSLEVTPLLEKIHSLMAGNKWPAREIFELSEVDAPFDVFLVFIDELIKSQFLVSELRQGPTIKNEVKGYIDILKRIEEEGNGNAGKYIALLTALQTTADNFSRLPLGTLPLDEFNGIKEQLDLCKVDSCQGHLFHADLKKTPGQGFVFSSEQVSQVKKGVVILSKLCGSKEKGSDPLANFKTLFEKKYGSREIPVSEALDPEYGIAFPPAESIGNTLFNSLIEKVHPAEKDRKNPILKSELIYSPSVEELNITDEDLPAKDDLEGVPVYFSVMGHLLPSGQILMEGVGKTHANSLPGRFAGLETGTLELCKEIAADEQSKNEEIIFAEIVFQPGGRTGNIAQRPSFFEYEIPYLAPGGVDEEKQIPVGDLLLSVRNNELVLRSSRLNRRVIPRLSNAHNFSISSLPVYQFLSFLQYPNERTLEMNWGNPGLKRRYLPRVIYGNLVLHRSRWFLHREDITGITGSDDPKVALIDFLSKWKVARFVSLADGDNELFIDTANTEYLQLLLKEMDKREAMKLVEWPFALPLNRNASERTEIKQFVLPLAIKEGKKHFPFSKPANQKGLKEVFEPGSEWVYFKIYCSAGFSDSILKEAVKPTIDHLLKENVIIKAFFIRYTDPHYHIRFRMQLRENDRQNAFAASVDCFYSRMQKYLNSGIVWDMQLDTYRRETERYGLESIEISEEAFFHDSQLFLKCLAHEVFAGNDETRFLSAIRNLNSWFTVFRLTTQEKVDFCEAISEGFAREFGREIKISMDIKYRELSNVLPTFMDSFIFDREFADREARLLKLQLPEKNLASYIHMSMNRWFVTEQRLLEYMCYVFAGKYYKQVLNYHL